MLLFIKSYIIRYLYFPIYKGHFIYCPDIVYNAQIVYFARNGYKPMGPTILFFLVISAASASLGH